MLLTNNSNITFMKKVLTYFMSAMMSISLFTGCSSDDKEEIQPDHTGIYSGDKLDLEISDIDIENAEAVINGKTLTIKNSIPGEESVEIPVTVKGNVIEGSVTNSNRAISVKGVFKDVTKVVGQELELEVTLKYTNSIVGVWNFTPFKQGEDGSFVSSPVFVDVTSPEGTVPMELFPGFVQNVPDQTYEQFLGGMLGAYAQELKSLNFREDGFIVASYTDPSKADTPLGAVRYFVKGGMVYLIPNTSMIMDGMTRAGMDDVAEMLTNGIPLILEIEGDALKAYVTKEMMAPFVELLDMILPSLPEDNSLVAMLNQYYPLFKEPFTLCSQYNMGMTLAK